MDDTTTWENITLKDENSDKLIVRYRNEYYDLSRFRRKHPGGLNTLSGLEDTDITKRLQLAAPPHSDAAMYLMNEYKITNLNSCLCDNNNSNNDKETNLPQLNGCKTQNGSAVQEESANKDLHDVNGIAVKTDESMEHLVDWSKAMLPQIAKISNEYNEWVNKPVDRKLQLFEPWYLETMSKTPWFLVPLIWIPVIFYLIHDGFSDSTQLALKNFKYFPILFGVFLWTLIEYSLHRFIFHMTPTKGNKWLCTFHFLLHGLHHKVPFDPYRLVFPPTAAVIIATIIYIPVYYTFSCPKLILSGGLMGYVCYDLIHYYLHYGNPAIWHLYQMKRYHYQHHFVRHDIGFGISSPFWDLVFGTRIHLRKLKYILKW